MSKTVEQTKIERPDWVHLLKEALTVPGRLSEAYSVFHNYSLGNRMLAVEQLSMRGLPVAPIASFNKWKELGRSVRKGAKAIALYMPVTAKVKAASSKEEQSNVTVDDAEAGTTGKRTFFVMRRNWFSFDQTEGDSERPAPVIPEWSAEKAMQQLGIKEVPFNHIDGNCQGYAKHGVMEIAINPLAALPHKTRFHEIAHHLLGHTKQGEGVGVMADSSELPKCIKEAEAEATAFLCCATLGLPGIEESRGYIQSWLDGGEFPEKSASRVFSVANRILNAGSVKDEGANDE